MPVCTLPASIGAHVRARAGRLQPDRIGLCKHRSRQHSFEGYHTVLASASNRDKSSSSDAHRLGSPQAVVRLCHRIYKFADAQFLPVALLSALTVGYFQPAAAVAAKDAGIGNAATLVIFILSGTCTELSYHRQLPVHALNTYRVGVLQLSGEIWSGLACSETQATLPPLQSSYGQTNLPAIRTHYRQSEVRLNCFSVL